MIGQEKLVNTFRNYTIDTLPKTIMLVGDVGCGKHTLINECINKNMLIKEFNSITGDDVLDLCLVSSPTLVVIDIDDFNEKQQNTILKLIEEPPHFVFIVIVCSNKLGVLDTIINRCIEYNFETYTKEQLFQFIQKQEDSELILSMCKTPGQVLSYNSCDINAIIELCDKIIDKLSIANYGNTLSITNKINCNKEDVDKFDFKIFMNLLIKKLYIKYIDTLDSKLYEMYKIANEYLKRYDKDKRLSKQYLMNELLTKLWKQVRI